MCQGTPARVACGKGSLWESPNSIKTDSRPTPGIALARIPIPRPSVEAQTVQGWEPEGPRMEEGRANTLPAPP